MFMRGAVALIWIQLSFLQPLKLLLGAGVGSGCDDALSAEHDDGEGNFNSFGTPPSFHQLLSLLSVAQLRCSLAHCIPVWISWLR